MGWKKIENGYADEEEISDKEDTEWAESSTCPGETKDAWKIQMRHQSRLLFLKK
jgi:hypothetical protein